MQVTDILQSLFRWIHVVAGVLWIGHLYFFNFVNGPFVALLDAETKKKVVPELMPRALFWFRWGAAWTWVSGLFLLMVVFYHGGALLDNPSQGWTLPVIVMVAVTFAATHLYDRLMKSSLAKKNMKAAIGIGFVLIATIACLMSHWAGFSYRGYSIHIGALFGTIMAFNVWFRIWPAQQKIIAAVKNGEKPDADLVAMAGLRSRHNTYLSVPLIWTMLNQHTTWSSACVSCLLAAIIVSWIVVNRLYKKAGQVKGL